MPSPTKAVNPFFAIFSYSLNLSSGNISYFISSIFNLLPTSKAISFLSPVNIIDFIPNLFNLLITSLVFFLIPSSKIIEQICLPSIFT